MNSGVLMFNNAGLGFYYEKDSKMYSVVEIFSNKEELTTGDALSAWTYYIQRVDTIVRRRIAESEKKRIKRELTEDDFFGV